MPPNISEIQAQVNALLAKQKDFRVQIDRLTGDKDSLSGQLDTATLRYMKAERKLDRLKSAQVQKLEQQAFAQATARPGASDQQNGMDIDSPSAGGGEALQSALHEATAVAEKRKEQLESALAEARSLREELTAVQARQTSLSEEDYSRTEVFRLFKGQNEDLIKRVNHLEAANKSLQSMNEQLKKEREASRKQLETEAQALIADLEDQLQQADTNLVRIRATRDELLAEVTALRNGKEQERTAIQHMKELLGASEDRIGTLEAELNRLQPKDEDVDMEPQPEIDALSPDELREKHKKLLQDYKSIESELPGLTKALRRFQSLANTKVMDFTALEERVALSIAEKSKADQKYFNTRKDADQKSEEIKKLRVQNNKSSDIISQLKEVEAQNRTLVTNLDKQLADMKQTNASLMTENKKLDSSSGEAVRRFDSLKQQVSDLTGLAKSKDSTTSTARERTAALEADVEKLKVRLDTTSKDRDKWKAKSLSNSSEEEEMLRVSLFSHLFFKFYVTDERVAETRNLLDMPNQFQGHCHSNLWPCLLQGLCRRQNSKPYAQMPCMQQGLRQIGLYAYPFIMQDTEPTTTDRWDMWAFKRTLWRKGTKLRTNGLWGTTCKTRLYIL